MRTILGIDPGLKGGISVIDERMGLIATYPMPTVKVEKGNKVDPFAVHEIMSRHQIDLVVIEKVGSRPGQGVTSMFNFGDGYGIVRGIAAVHCKRIEYVRPQAWRGSQMMSGLDKEQIADVAFEIFKADQIFGKTNKRTGKRPVRDGISDSLMIAKYGILLLE